MELLQERLLHYFIRERTSSGYDAPKAMIAGALGYMEYKAHPIDLDCINRCLKLLSCAPELRDGFHLIAHLSPAWKVWIKRWAEVEALFLDDIGIDWIKGHSSLRLLELLDDIAMEIDGAHPASQSAWTADLT